MKQSSDNGVSQLWALKVSDGTYETFEQYDDALVRTRDCRNKSVAPLTRPFYVNSDLLRQICGTIPQSDLDWLEQRGDTLCAIVKGLKGGTPIDPDDMYDELLSVRLVYPADLWYGLMEYVLVANDEVVREEHRIEVEASH